MSSHSWIRATDLVRVKFFRAILLILLPVVLIIASFIRDAKQYLRQEGRPS